MRSAGNGAQRLKTDLWPWRSLAVGSWAEWFMRINPASDIKFTVCLWFKLLCVSKKVFVDMVDFYERISNSVYLLQIKPDERVLITERGLLIRWLQHSDAGSYFCTSQEHSFTRTLLHLSLTSWTADRSKHTNLLHGNHQKIRPWPNLVSSIRTTCACWAAPCALWMSTAKRFGSKRRSKNRRANGSTFKSSARAGTDATTRGINEAWNRLWG